MRRTIGYLTGISLALAAGTASLGEQLAKARMGVAADFPLNSAASARRLLDGGTPPLPNAKSDRIAREALGAAPLSGEAAVWLSDRAFAAGNKRRGLDVLQSAAALSWHGELVQRVSYIRALERDDYSIAATRAEALLRRGRAREQLAADFAEAAENSAYSNAIVNALTEDAPWSNGLLAQQGAVMPYSLLREIFTARSNVGTPLPRKIAAPILAGIALDNRFGEGAKLAALMDGAQTGRLIPGWPSAEAEALPTPYDWRLFDGYAPLPGAKGKGFELSRTDAAAPRPVQLLLALAPGTYRLAIPGASADTLAGWRYAFACGLSTQRPAIRLAATQTLKVSPGCATQVLSLSASLQVSAGPNLPELALKKTG